MLDKIEALVLAKHGIGGRGPGGTALPTNGTAVPEDKAAAAKRPAQGKPAN